LIEYARHIKMGDGTDEYGDDFHYAFVDKHDQHIDIRNFSVTENEFTKFIPMGHNGSYLQVFKSKDFFEKKLLYLKLKIISIQILLLLIFALISYRLARNALRPLEESIETLDKFAKDLIHDLNTPVAAMKLNIRLLEKDQKTKDLNAVMRLKKSVDTVSELRENLTILLEKKTFQITTINMCDIIRDVIQLHQPNYPDLDFQISCHSLLVEANTKAMKQILHNLISNACRYNTPKGYVKIYIENESLCIEDSGMGIKEPEKIFDREYSAQNSSGLGLDIVKRLCDAMGVKIEVTSSEKGSRFCLSL